jgi:hypothetical protein
LREPIGTSVIGDAPSRLDRMQRVVYVQRTTALLSIGLLVVSCSGADVSGTRVDSIAAAITLSAGGAATVAQSATLQLSATVSNKSGIPLSGQSVVWSSSSPTVASISTTGLLAAGIIAGRTTVTASSGGVTSAPLVVAVPAGTAAAARVATDVFANPVVGSTSVIGVIATDSNGNPVPGCQVTFTLTAGGGAVSIGANASTSTLVATTDSAGVASVSWTLGRTVGANTLTAAAAGVAGPALTLTTTAIPGPPAAIARIGAAPSNIVAGQPAGSLIGVTVSDAMGNPIAGVSVAFAVTAGGGTVAPSNAITDALGQATTVFTTGPTVGTNTANATVAGLSPLSIGTVTIAGAPQSLSIVGPRVVVTDVGGSLPLAVVTKDANGNVTTSTATYVSRSVAVANISTSGVLSGLTAGQSIIVAAAGGASDSILAISAKPDGPALTTDLANFTQLRGAIVAVNVFVDMRESTRRVGSATIDVTWDPQVLTYQSNSDPAGAGTIVNTLDAAAGKVRLAVASASGLASRAQLLQLRFVGGSTAGATTTIGLVVHQASATDFSDLLPAAVGASIPIIIH